MLEQIHTESFVPEEHGDEPPSNLSDNPTFTTIAEARYARRGVMKGGLAAAVTGLMGTSFLSSPANAAAEGGPLIGFKAIPTDASDQIVVPEGYSIQVIMAQGTPITGHMPAYSLDNTGEEQGMQTGAHHDGMHFFPIEGEDPYEGSSTDGLLVMNHEYIEPRFMHRASIGQAHNSSAVPMNEDGTRDPDQVLKEINAHGVSIARVQKGEDGQWAVVEDPRNRRVTGLTPMEIGGPVRGSDRVKTKYSPEGHASRGILNQCAHGVTPWNTYMTSEENWAGYFVNHDTENGEPKRPREHARYGVPTNKSRYGWELAAGGADEYIRFDASAKADEPTGDYRNEPNTFGWLVEIDPFDPESTPVKRTWLGRFAHEGVIFAPAVAGQKIVCYSGDDARGEYIYKFVSAEAYDPATAGGHLLDDGRLYVARFNDDGTGEWLPLVFGEHGLTPQNGFADQADVLVNTRLAADHVGATKMDRPEWGAVDPSNGDVYFTLSNNADRTLVEVDAANPRPENQFGQIIRWSETVDQSATTFTWDLFVIAGPASNSATFAGEPLGEDSLFACPDGLWFDPDSRLWIQTDIGESAQNKGDLEIFGNNQMLCANPVTGEIRRFLTGPMGQEITGVVTTPDQRTMFINVQHPGATTSAEQWAAGEITSHWPDGGDAYPRSATVVITKDDGGSIGT
jgi:uncharacterized protein